MAIEDLKPYQWQKGQSGNPGGYSRGRRAVDHLLDLIGERDANRTIAELWLSQIQSGNFQFFKEYLERRDGKVATIDELPPPESNVVQQAQAKALERKRQRESGGASS